MCLRTVGIVRVYEILPGLLMASVLQRQAMIILYKSGTRLAVDTSIPIMDIRRQPPWPGHPMGRALPQPVMTRGYKSGKPASQVSYYPVWFPADITRILAPWYWCGSPACISKRQHSQTPCHVEVWRY